MIFDFPLHSCYARLVDVSLVHFFSRRFYGLQGSLPRSSREVGLLNNAELEAFLPGERAYLKNSQPIEEFFQVKMERLDSVLIGSDG